MKILTFSLFQRKILGGMPRSLSTVCDEADNTSASYQIRNKIFSIGISEIVCLFKHLLFEMLIDTSSAFVRSLKIERLILLYIF